MADIVLTKPVSDEVKKHVGLWTGCVAGALEIEDYKARLIAAGFESAEVEVVRTYSMEDTKGLVADDLIEELGRDETEELMGSFVSSFVRARKPK